MPPSNSIRESVLEYLLGTTLPAIVAGSTYNFTVKTIERGRRSYQEMGAHEFPALFIVSTHEKVSNINQTQAEIDLEVILLGYVMNSKSSIGASGTGTQRDLGKFIQDVKNALEADPLLGDRVKWLEIQEVTTDDGDLTPVGGFVLSVRLEYVERRGAS